MRSLKENDRWRQTGAYTHTNEQTNGGIMDATWGGDRRAIIRRNQPDDVRLIPPYILRARA